MKRHGKLSVRLQELRSNYLRSIDGTLKAADARVDNRCALGRWLYGEGKMYSSTSEYQILIGEHVRFHRAAGEVIDRANSGKEVNADRILHSDSEALSELCVGF